MHVTNYSHFNANNFLAIYSGVVGREFEYLRLDTKVPCLYLVGTFPLWQLSSLVLTGLLQMGTKWLILPCRCFLVTTQRVSPLLFVSTIIHMLLTATFIFQPRILFSSEFHPSWTVDIFCFSTSQRCRVPLFKNISTFLYHLWPSDHIASCSKW